MKILLVNKFLHPNGGSETYIFKLGEYLSSIGHDVQFFGMDDENRIVGNRINSYVSKVDFHKLNKFRKIVYVFKSIYSFEARSKIRNVLDDFSPDVVHLNNFNYQLTPSIILEIDRWRKFYKKKCNIVYTAHDYQLLCPNHQFHSLKYSKNCEKCLHGNYFHCVKQRCIHNSIFKSIVGSIEAFFWKRVGVYKKIDCVICCSNFIKTKMDQLSVFKNKTVCLHNFITNSSIQSSFSTKSNYILYFGRYSEEKGIKTLIDVCKELKNVSFVFAGSGPLEHEVNQVTNIKNLGFVNGDYLNQVISSALFSIYPSEWYENCPFSVMESQLCGTPVVGANIGGIPELINNGISGVLFESGNKEQLKKTILNLLSNKDLLSFYSKNCINHSFLDLSSYTKQILKIYTKDFKGYTK